MFTDSHLYFQGVNRTFREDIVTDVDEMPWALKRGNHSAFPNRQYPRHVGGYIYDRLEEYYPKHLSFKSDCINAFEGIFAAHHRESYCRHFWGIPIIYLRSVWENSKVAFFTVGLTWMVHQPLEEHEMTTSSDNADFPSWSWAALKARRPDDNMGWLSFQPKEADESVCRWRPFNLLGPDGKSVTLEEYTNRAVSYKAYQPQLGFQNWSISAKALLQKPPPLDADMSERTTPSLRFDTLTPDWENRNIMAVFLYAWTRNRSDMLDFDLPNTSQMTAGLRRVFEIVGLLVEEVGVGQWRRVGVWRVRERLRLSDLPGLLEGEDEVSGHVGGGPFFDGEKLLASCSGVGGVEAEERWEMRDLILV